MNATAIKLVIKFWHDECAEDPSAWGGWKVHSFSRRHSGFAKPENIGFEWDDEGDHVPSKELQAKLDNGLAFMLDYFEHGQCAWSLSGSGPQCRWDTTRMAGLLVWEGEEDDIGAETVEDRREDARSFLSTYTEWCNGEVYGYTVEAYSKCPTCGQHEEVEESVVDFDMPSCGGYYGDSLDTMIEDMKEHIGSDWADYEVEFKEQEGYGLADECKRRWKGSK